MLEALFGIPMWQKTMEDMEIQHDAKHGRWDLTSTPSFKKCSECGAWWSSDITDNPFVHYCPTCGAIMDLNTPIDVYKKQKIDR